MVNVRNIKVRLCALELYGCVCLALHHWKSLLYHTTLIKLHLQQLTLEECKPALFSHTDVLKLTCTSSQKEGTELYL